KFWFLVRYRIEKGLLSGCQGAVVVRTTLQNYNREIALYEFFGKFFSGFWNFFFCTGSRVSWVSWCHGVKLISEVSKSSLYRNN
ncbi:MAG: hypothetical protein K6A94_02995, partial [Bacteroidales bacterium]|nr:hypothetical protein [Bacteroidales bacterium]